MRFRNLSPLTYCKSKIIWQQHPQQQHPRTALANDPGPRCGWQSDGRRVLQRHQLLQQAIGPVRVSRATLDEDRLNKVNRRHRWSDPDVSWVWKARDFTDSGWSTLCTAMHCAVKLQERKQIARPLAQSICASSIVVLTKITWNQCWWRYLAVQFDFLFSVHYGCNAISYPEILALLGL